MLYVYIPGLLQAFRPSLVSVRELQSASVSFSTWTSSCPVGQLRMTKERKKLKDLRQTIHTGLN